MAGVLLVIMGIVGSVMFARDRYRFWKSVGRSKVLLKSIGAGLAMMSGLAAIIAIAWITL